LPKLPRTAITNELLKAELAKLSSETLAYIDRCQYEVTGQLISEVIESIMWDRYSTAGGAWPTSEPVPDDDLGRPFKFQYITYCAKAVSPDDPAHQVARSLRVEINGVDYGKNDGFLCSCGEQLKVCGRSQPRQRRVSSGEPARVWPSVTMGGVHYLAVCKAAPSPVDLDHGPLLFMERCICGSRFPDPTDIDKSKTTLEKHYRLWDAQ